MPTIKFFYADMHFWRAECIRLALHAGDVPFEDIRASSTEGVSLREELTKAGKLPFGGLPVMDVDGKMLSQTQAMAAYAGKIAGIHPSDPFLAAKVDEIINGCTDVTMTIASTFKLPADDKIPERVKLIQPDGRLYMHVGGGSRRYACQPTSECVSPEATSA